MSALHAGTVFDQHDDSARHYVNTLTVNVSLSAIRFDLAALGPGAEGRDTVWRFVTTPSRIHSFHARLGQAIDSYRSEFGEISSPDEESPDGKGDGAHG